MNSIKPHFLLFYLLPFCCLLNCALTADGVSLGIQGDYYDPASPDGNNAYFTNVQQHFYSIGFRLPDGEVRAYTAVRHITSQPPVAAVYDGAQYLGRTNSGPLYFKPGQYRVTFSKNGCDRSEILHFAEGRNASLMVTIR